MTIDINAPIIPWVGIGGIKLYSTLNELKPIIQNAEILQLDAHLVRYEIPGIIDLFFNLNNNKLYKITTLEKYNGSLFNFIMHGTPIQEVLNKEKSFEYDDFEEVYFSNKGIFIETCPEKNTVMWISVFIKELETEVFDSGQW